MTALTAATQELDTARDVHVAALNAGDADAWAGCFAADGVQMPPNAPANVGMESILGFCRGLLGMFDVEFSMVPADIEVAGECVIEHGAYDIALTPHAGGEGMQDTGKYVTTYRREVDGAWRISRDIWNSDRR